MRLALSKAMRNNKTKTKIRFFAKAITGPLLLLGAYIWWDSSWQVSGMLSLASLFYFLMAQQELQLLSAPLHRFSDEERMKILRKRMQRPARHK